MNNQDETMKSSNFNKLYPTEPKIFDIIFEYVNTGDAFTRYKNTNNSSLTCKFFNIKTKEELAKNFIKKSGVAELILALNQAKNLANDNPIFDYIINDLESLMKLNGEDRQLRLGVFVFYFLFERPHEVHLFDNKAQAAIEKFISMHLTEMDKSQEKIKKYLEESLNDEQEASWSGKCESVSKAFSEFGGLMKRDFI